MSSSSRCAGAGPARNRHGPRGRPSAAGGHRARSLAGGLLAAVALLAGCAAPTAPAVTFHPPAGVARPSYSEAVEVRAGGLSTLYVSGLVPEPVDPAAAPGARSRFGDTQVQTDGILQRLKALLAARGYALRDVVKVNVYLVADPAKSSLTDGDGFNAAYARAFGTAETPTLPARTRMGVASLTNPLWLVALDVVAARATP